MADSVTIKSSVKVIEELVTLFFLSALALLLGIYSSQESFRMKSDGIEVNAYVVDTYLMPRSGNGYTIEYYTTNNTKVIVNTSNLGDVNKGDVIKILYDPNNLDKINLADSKSKVWVWYLAASILFLLAILYSGAILLDNISAHKKPPK